MTVHTPLGDQYIVFSDCRVQVKEDAVLGVFPMRSNWRYRVLFSHKVVQLVDKTWDDFGQQIDVIWDLVMVRYFDIFITLHCDWSKDVEYVIKKLTNYLFKI